MSFSVPYKVETTSGTGGGVATSDTSEWQTTTVTTAMPPQRSPQE